MGMDFGSSASSEEIKIPFGKHKGTLITEVGDHWLLWCATNFEDDHFFMPQIKAECADRELDVQAHIEAERECGDPDDKWW